MMSLFNGLIDFVARILAFFYELPLVGASYGMAIIMLTFAVMVLLMPLTLKATRSTIRLQEVQPELKRIQKEYKDDREQLNAEVMKLYSEYGINPLGGCLPMIAQMPVFLVLFRVLQGLTRRFEDLPFFEVSNKLRVARGLQPIDGERFDPQYLDRDSALYQDLVASTEMDFGPLDLSARAWDVLRTDFVSAIPYLILIAFIVAASYYQQRQIQARRTDDAPSSPMMQQQQMLMKVLPLMTGIWSFFFPAGLPLYWAASSVFRIGQQAYITHQIYGIEAERKKAEEAEGSGSSTVASRSKGAAAADDASGPDSEQADEKPRQKAEKKGGKKPQKDGSGQSGGDADGTRATDKKKQSWESKRTATTRGRQRDTSGRGSNGSGSRRVTPKGTKSPDRAKKKKR